MSMLHAPCHEVLPPFGCSYAIGWLTPHPLTSVHTVLFFLNVKGNKYCLSGNSYGVLLFLPSRFSYSFFLKRNNLPSFFSEAANATWDLRFTWKVVHQNSEMCQKWKQKKWCHNTADISRKYNVSKVYQSQINNCSNFNQGLRINLSNWYLISQRIH